MNKLPKLTAEVFNRKDCPDWANYAAVDRCGFAYWHKNKPEICGGCCWSGNPSTKFIIGEFDPEGWENSLVERFSSIGLHGGRRTLLATDWAWNIDENEQSSFT